MGRWVARQCIAVCCSYCIILIPFVPKGCQRWALVLLNSRLLEGWYRECVSDNPDLTRTKFLTTAIRIVFSILHSTTTSGLFLLCIKGQQHPLQEIPPPQVTSVLLQPNTLNSTGKKNGLRKPPASVYCNNIVARRLCKLSDR